LINNCTIAGRLVRDMEVRYLQSGTAVGNFTLACDRPKYKDREKETDFIDCTMWGDRAEKVSQYLTKGKPICVIGALNIRNYEDQQGIKRKAATINVDKLQFLPDGKSGNQQQRPAAGLEHSQEISFNEEDIPF
jgi:single-strand DNA-binding protein